jgi:3-deoxy-manno-octulosonate cytidylyltransferase (CMP-KDO synthetase)
MMPAAVIGQVAAALSTRPLIDIASAVAPISSVAEFLDTSCVKALRAPDGSALYFSRAPVPWPRDSVTDGRPTHFAGAWRHIGIYAYRVRSLLKFASWTPTPLEETEKLEQLRALEHGMQIHLVTFPKAPPPGVDTPEDLERVRAALTGARAPR